MIYNLREHLATEIPTLVFITDGWEVDSPEESTLVRQTGGEPQHWVDRTDFTIQVISRANSKPAARSANYAVYNELKNRFGLTLPSVTVDGEVFPAVKTYQISPIQAPGYIGADEQARHMYSVNFTITTGG